ncbi:MAG: M48 family metallopeptidase, partial [Anaerolineaceae bacterium]
VIDYVVIHELVHLEEKNHGKAFWAKVNALMPDYKQKIAWLKKNGQRLNV